MCTRPDRRRRVLIVGTPREADDLARHITGAASDRAVLIGRVRIVAAPERLVSANIHAVLEGNRTLRIWSPDGLNDRTSVPCLGDVGALSETLVRHAVDLVVVSESTASGDSGGDVLAACAWTGRDVLTAESFRDEYLHGAISPQTALGDAGWRTTARERLSRDVVKRALDLCVATIGVMMLAPLALARFALRRTNAMTCRPTSATYVGCRGHLFTVRSGRTGPSNGATGDSGPAGGTWERLLAVLTGDMSLVGPRPELADVAAQLEQLVPHYRLRQIIQPGLTGWAQSRGYRVGDAAAAERELCADLYYIKHRSLGMDLRIMAREIRRWLLHRIRSKQQRSGQSDSSSVSERVA